jgi:serine/threonine-protein kinase HipA
MNGVFAGTLEKHSSKDYRFQYDPGYLSNGKPLPICHALKLQATPYTSDQLFPFFENLLAEGWLRETQSQLQKIDERDSFGLLLNNGEDLIGAVTIKPINPPDNQVTS